MMQVWRRKALRPESLVLALGVVSRVAGLTHDNLWHDEAFTGLVAPLPWARFWEALLGDVHPPLWYLVERASIAVMGQSTLAVRLPATLCSIAALLLFWRLARGCDMPRPARLAALALMAVSPFQIYYAQEGRMYAALTLAAVAMLEGAIRRRRWEFAAGALAALWLHNLGPVYVFAGSLVIVVREIRRPVDMLVTLLDWWPAALAVAGLGAPAVAWTVYQIGKVAPGYWIIDKSIGSWLYHAFFCQFLGGGMMDSRLSWNGALAAVILALGGLAAGLRARRWEWLVMGWTPGLVVLAYSNLVQPMLLSRTLIGSGPALYLLGGQLFSSARRRWGLSLLLAPLIVSSLATHYLTERRGDLGSLIATVEVERPAAIMHSQTGAYIVMAWHMPGYDHVVWDGGAHGLANSVSDRTAAALGMERAALLDLPRPVGIIYADYALVSPQERATILSELEAAGAELAYTLADDPVQRIDLWMLR